MERRVIYRQGDALLIEEKIPPAAKRRTEHAVAIPSETGKNGHTIKGVAVFENGSDIYIQAEEPRPLEHDGDHEDILIHSGSYRVSTVRARDEAEKVFARPPGRGTAQRTTPVD